MSTTSLNDKQMSQLATDVAINGFDEHNAVPFIENLVKYDETQQYHIMKVAMAMHDLKYMSDTQKKIVFCWLYLNLMRCKINVINEFKYDPKILLTTDENLPSWEFIQKCLVEFYAVEPEN